MEPLDAVLAARAVKYFAPGFGLQFEAQFAVGFGVASEIGHEIVLEADGFVEIARLAHRVAFESQFEVAFESRFEVPFVIRSETELEVMIWEIQMVND